MDIDVPIKITDYRPGLREITWNLKEHARMRNISNKGNAISSGEA
jgi:hypothetical protein